MLEQGVILALAISFLLDKHVERQHKKAEIEKLKQEIKKLALENKKASR